MRLGKAVRLLEEMLSQICDNNIDQSILSKEKDFENIESGFTWLYTNDDAWGKTMVLDVRDEKRFLDYLKYQLIIEKRYSSRPFNNVAFEEDFVLLKEAFFKLDFRSQPENADLTQESLIRDYKQKLASVIKAFFVGYKQLVEYRNALIHIPTLRKHSRLRLFRNKEALLHYANTLVQVLIDLFSSFVKMNKLNLGNSILDKGWFNYSDLSESSFTHSSFKYARLEDSILQNCDLSICNFTDADASSTDFTGSHFSYSNLTGMDLSECTLNNAHMNKVLLRDPGLDDYILGLNYLAKNDENAKEMIDAFALKKDLPAPPPLMDSVIDKETKTFYPERIPNWVLSFCHQKEGAIIDDVLLKRIKALLDSEDANAKTERENLYGKINTSVAKLKGASFNGEVSLGETDFSHADMSEAAFREADLSQSKMYYSTAKNAMFFRSNLNQLDAFRANFESSSFNEASMINSVLADCTLNSCNFKKAIMLGATIVYSDKKGPSEQFCSGLYNQIETDEQQTDLPIQKKVNEDVGKSLNKNAFSSIGDFCEVLADRITIVNANMNRSRFQGAMMRDSLLQNDLMWWCSFKDVNLSNSIVSDVSFYQSSLSNVQLARARILNSDFDGADLASARFISAFIEKCNFDESNLIGANLSSATIKNCVFSCCSFGKMILMDTTFENVIFDRVDFTETIGLERAKFKRCVFIENEKNGARGTLVKKIDYEIAGPNGLKIPMFKDGEKDNNNALPRYSSFNTELQ